MNGSGRGDGWESQPDPMPVEEEAQVEAFPAPQLEDQHIDNDEYYQEGVGDSEMMNQDMNAEMEDEGGQCETDADMQEGDQKPKPKRPWGKPFHGFRSRRRKPPGAKNIKIRRVVQPKNAVMCLNELKSGIVYTIEQEANTGQPYCISVEIDGQKYRGFGSSKQLAKQAAAEVALISFVKPPVPTAEFQEEDKTPWATLASFAIYKLFTDWREGRVGMCSAPSPPYAAAMTSDIKALQKSAIPATSLFKDGKLQTSQFPQAFFGHLGGQASMPMEPKSNDLTKIPNPAKQIPESAATMHPVMVLHQMKPSLQYNISQIVKDGKPHFCAMIELDGQEFCGEGATVKKAKFLLAKAAILSLYGIESTFDITS